MGADQQQAEATSAAAAQPAAALPRLLSGRQVVLRPSAYDTSSVMTATAECPAGKQVVRGGAANPGFPPNYLDQHVVLTQLYPYRPGNIAPLT